MELKYRIYRYSETALLLEFLETIPEKAYPMVQRVYEFSGKALLPFFTELIPAFNSLLFSGCKPSDISMIAQRLDNFLSQITFQQQLSVKQVIEIPVCYDIALGNDLLEMEKTLGIPVSKITELHSSVKYHVYMIGFLPGFAYMGAVENDIAMSRKPQPVPTKAGAVGIAGIQTGIYPFDSPGGWHIVGYTPILMFDPLRLNPAYLSVGSEVIFLPVNLDTYLSISANGHANS